MKKKKAKKNSGLMNISKQPLFKPITIDMIGTSDDPCFGIGYDLSTRECKSCGDSELCSIQFAQKLGKTRKKLEEEKQFKDLDILIDKVAAKKYYRTLKRKGLEKSDLLDKLQSKFELTRKEARQLYKEFKTE